MSFIPPSITLMSFSFKISTIVSAKPTQFIDALIVFASHRTKPIEPPNSGPKEREI